MADEVININVKVEDALSVSLEAIRVAQEVAWYQGVDSAFSASIEDDSWTPGDLVNPYRKADDAS